MNYDVVIVGGGMAGTLLALGLAQTSSLSIAILEAQEKTLSWDEKKSHPRVSAITLASQRILQNLGVWSYIQSRRISPFRAIQVWDTQANHLEFTSEAIAEAQLGFIIENNLIQQALYEALKAYPAVTWHAPIALAKLEQQDNEIKLFTDKQQTITARCVVAADGANSWVREAVNISLEKKDYHQQAIVATVTTELPHQSIARQVFLSSGPLAFLPLSSPCTASIVWSLPPLEAERLLTLDEAAFADALGEAFSHRLGKILLLETRFKFPLYRQQAKRYIDQRIAFIGDAAHTVHPLAGQGVNIAFLDAASLIDVIVDAERCQRDWSSQAVLRRYERWRKGDNFLLLNAIDKMQWFFGSENPTLSSLRDVGFVLASPFKNYFSRYAVGLRDGLPTFANQ